MSVPRRSATHLVLIPSYNPGPVVYETVRGARAYWSPVWVVVDGSDDGTPAGLEAMAREDPELRVVVLPANRGKGTAVLHGLELASGEGFTHVLTMDSDGQHPASVIPEFMARSAAEPGAMILGDPVFDASAPRIRLRGRRIANALTNLETLWEGIHDSLFGFRVYPIGPLLAAMRTRRSMRGFDFDPEAAVRLVWMGVRPVNLPARVRYLKAEEGGVSHFDYWRDNVLLAGMYCRLFGGFLLRAPTLLARRYSRASARPSRRSPR